MRHSESYLQVAKRQQHCPNCSATLRVHTNPPYGWTCPNCPDGAIGLLDPKELFDSLPER